MLGHALEWMMNRLRGEHVMGLVLAALIGAAAALGALAFRAMIMGTELVFWGAGGLSPDVLREAPWWWRLLAPAVGGLLIAPIVVRWAPDARGSGIPEVIEAVALRGGHVPSRIAPLKAIAASICIGSGGSAGREGPIVHIGGAIGSWMARRFRASARHVRTFVGCGVAGGIAATFNAPFAGALFAIEVVLGDFGTAKISPIVIASITATVISRHYKGDFPHIDVPAFEEQTSILSVGLYVWLGVICAIISAVFIKLMVGGWSLARWWPFSPYLMPAFGGLVVGLISLAFPEVAGVGYHTINAVMLGQFDALLLLLLVGAKMLATTATLTSGGSGGVFAPSLVVGAIAGALMGQVFQYLFPGMIHSPTVYILIGMGAVVAGTTRAPISAILIIFELTYQPAIIVPLMAACIPAMIIAAYLHPESIYIARLTMKGVRLVRQGEINLLKGKTVASVMRQRVDSAPPTMGLAEIVDRFLQSPYSVMWLVQPDGRLAGVLESQNLQIAMLEKDSLFTLITAEDMAVPPTATIRPGDDLSYAAALFNRIPQEIVPVLDPDTEQVMGDLQRSDVIQAYNRELSQRDALNVAVDAIGMADRLGSVDLGDGYSLVEFEVPSHLAGRTFLQLELRRRFGIQAVLLRRGGRSLMPGPDSALEPGDKILFVGESASILECLEKM